MNFKDVIWAQTSMEMLGHIDSGTMKAPRPGRDHYLGMSGIGGCAAEQWRRYHHENTHGENIEPKLQRVFDLGHALEDVVMEYIEAAGVDIVSTQAAYSDFDDRLRGHSDLVYRTSEGKKVVSDVKTMNNYNFGLFNKLGVKSSHWKYYCQAMIYAHYEKADAVQIIAYNKDTSAIAVQTIAYDGFIGEMLRSRAGFILGAVDCPACEKGNGVVKWCGCKA